MFLYYSATLCRVNHQAAAVQRPHPRSHLNEKPP